MREYREYLAEMVGYSSCIAEVMFLTPFDTGHLVPNDVNRAYDAFSLRPDSIDPDTPANLLEVIVGVCFRIVDLADETTQHWGKMILDNLNIDASECDRSYLEDVCWQVVNRTYDFYGRGGLFPLLESDIDQTEVEIWYQMMHWLEEKDLP